jgi:cell wall-associated NlpC family hydrolase
MYPYASDKIIWIMKKITKDDLIPGDHIYVRRGGLIYSHHGIYAGEGTVFHFKGEEKEKQDPVVILTEIESFLNEGKLRRRHYQERLPRSESLGIAQGHLSEKGYSLPFNNCEHFATYCATGKKKSKQVRRAIGSFVTITVFAASSFIIKAITRKKQG